MCIRDRAEVEYPEEKDGLVVRKELAESEEKGAEVFLVGLTERHASAAREREGKPQGGGEVSANYARASQFISPVEKTLELFPRCHGWALAGLERDERERTNSILVSCRATCPGVGGVGGDRLGESSVKRATGTPSVPSWADPHSGVAPPERLEACKVRRSRLSMEPERSGVGVTSRFSGNMPRALFPYRRGNSTGEALYAVHEPLNWSP